MRLLLAADEVVWSCYRPALERAGDKKLLPAPLAYVEAQWSPSAYERDKKLVGGLARPEDVKSAQFVAGFVAKLPVPLLALPPWCLEAPWWLVYIGHEVGHHVLHDLELDDDFAEEVKKAAEYHSGLLDAKEVRIWTNCAEEIFADLYSVLTMGPWAIWALLEAIWCRDDLMAKWQPKLGYPSPAIRLALMMETASALRLDTVGMLRGVDIDALAGAAATDKGDQAVVKTIVALALPWLATRLGVGPDGLNGRFVANARVFRRDDTGTIERWATSLLNDPDRTPFQPELETARQVTCGGVCAWARSPPADGRGGALQGASDPRRCLAKNAPSRRIARGAPVPPECGFGGRPDVHQGTHGHPREKSFPW